jgi:hypothetical protein
MMNLPVFVLTPHLSLGCPFPAKVLVNRFAVRVKSGLKALGANITEGIPVSLIFVPVYTNYQRLSIINYAEILSFLLYTLLKRYADEGFGKQSPGWLNPDSAGRSGIGASLA